MQLHDPSYYSLKPADNLSLSLTAFCAIATRDLAVVLFHSIISHGWLVSYTALPCSGGSGLRTSELHCSPVLRRLGSAYQWVTLLSLVPEAQVCVQALNESTSFLCCLSAQYMNWGNSCKRHDRSTQTSHPWPCPVVEPRRTLAFTIFHISLPLFL